MGKFFGTDGIRGVANQDLTPELAFALGRAAGSFLLERYRSARPLEVLLGRDPRRSGGMLEAALTAGLCSVGLDVQRLGVVPTPAVAWLTRHRQACAGVMISASHNPAPDNGIKFFGPQGFKLPDADEAAIEARLEAPQGLPHPTGSAIGEVHEAPEAVEDYVAHLKGLLPGGLKGVRLALDCANGAASVLGPRVLQELGAEVTVIGASPDGDNINAGYGSTHLEALSRTVVEQGLPLGLAFDGDADRLLAVDAEGHLVDGDRLMWICLHHMRTTGLLDRADLVATVMSNLGLEEAVNRAGGKLIRAKVGDRYVLEEMVASGIQLGGEQSGHVIFLAHSTTGDGLVTSLRLLAALTAAGRPIGELAAEVPLYPQILRNVRVASTQGWQEHPQIRLALARAEASLVGQGRLLVRASGTEPLIRVMIEGQDPLLVEHLVSELCQVIAQALTRDVHSHAHPDTLLVPRRSH